MVVVAPPSSPMKMGGSFYCSANNSPSVLFFLFFSMGLLLSVNGAMGREKYIVYMGHLPNHNVDVREIHHELLSKVLGSHDAATECIMHSYTKSLNGFVANLTEEEADIMSGMDGVVSVFKSRTHKLHTTKSWDFLGFPRRARRNQMAESKVIVGVIDSGITLGSESFNDKGFRPPPAKWKGSCGPFANFTCNNKIIGAKWFRHDKKIPQSDVASPVDYLGHGTHTASIIAGAPVRANFYGLAHGIARGAVPSARIAVYKVCYADSECNEEDILDAFDAAIEDGVDIINLSIGQDTLDPLSLTNVAAIGSIHAMRKGILTSASAGNDGPDPQTLGNHSPWMMTVGASTINRQFVTKVMLGNGMNLTGISINTFEMEKPMYPLISGVDASAIRECTMQSLDPTKVKGKFVFCQVPGGAAEARQDIEMAYAATKEAGGIGTIVQVSSLDDTPHLPVIPATILGKEDGQIISDYLNSNRNGQAVIFKSTEVEVKAPHVASFSSRGPNRAYHSILKPDLVAPGVNVLAAYTPKSSINSDDRDTRYSKFFFASGTSMSAPFAAGAAAYVKTFHPTWSPAAIKSALMTTARVMDSSTTTEGDGEYAYGAGQIDPVRALDPGLVYDANEVSYISFLCKELTNLTAINELTGFTRSKPINCSAYPQALGQDGLNYPSMQYIVEETAKPSVAVFRRQVTNVGNGPAVYTATVTAPTGLEVIVEPSTLMFIRQTQKKSFKVMVGIQATNDPRPPSLVSASLAWSDKVHMVRSPIAVHFN